MNENNPQHAAAMIGLQAAAAGLAAVACAATGHALLAAVWALTATLTVARLTRARH